MKHIGIIIGYLFVISCQSNYERYKSELPKDELINEIFLEIAKIDSFRKDYGISSNIIRPVVYQWIDYSVINKDSSPPPPPPPPPPYSLSYNEVFTYFGGDSNLSKRLADSIFIDLQLDTARSLNISNELINNFANNKDKFYVFSIPIFSFDKKTVIVLYVRHCGDLCGYCHEIILRKEDDKWIKLHEYSCGVM